MTGREQKFLKTKGMIAFVAFMNMIVPLSLDMYLPAVPHMTRVFDTTETVVNFTLVGFFFFMAVGILIFGPLSDSYGRKPLLILGTAIYMIASGACALSPTIGFMIAARVVQALGAGCMMAIATALIKDCFEPGTRSRVLAVSQAMSVIAPMLAPIIGAWIITLSGWRATFWVLVILSGLCLIVDFLMVEPLRKEDRSRGSLMAGIKGPLKIAKNKAFSVYLLTVSLITAPYMAYISVCSYIYIDFFQMSETTYSYYFAANSAVAILGPILYLRTEKRVSPKTFMNMCIFVSLASGILIFTAGKAAALVFLLSYMPFTVLESAIRPFSTAILLEQQEGDTGSASALINFTHTVMGSLGMLLGALPWADFVTGLGILLTAFVSAALLGWVYILKSGIEIKGLTVPRKGG